MKTETLSKINILIQRIVYGAACNINSKEKLNSNDIIAICKEITELAEGEYELRTN